MKYLLIITLFCPLFFLSSCATLPSKYCDEANSIAVAAGLQKELVKADPFVLTTYHRIGKKGAPLRVYIEGDGYAWVTSSRPSADPTPHTPLVISLAAEDPAVNVGYIARPYQYTPEDLNRGVNSFYWTKGKFSEPVVSSMNRAVSHLAEKAGADGIELIGYSGGAAVAVLIAARRNDVKSLRTVAGSLDPAALHASRGLSSLKESLDPIDHAVKLKNIPMRHFIGTGDRVIPSSAAQSFAERTGDASYQSITEIKGVTHSEGWRERWRELLGMTLYKAQRSRS